MARWEYCRIVQPAIAGNVRPGPAIGTFLGPTAKETKVSQMRTASEVDFVLSRLGQDGWELVSHTLTWGNAESGGPDPVPLCEVFYLKRRIE